ncbi:hypothetical protein G6F36_011269 [Rhizopus arrhizus]|nr:hypothetical protein G6F36_011269 [Rhizopus arrhizus]
MTDIPDINEQPKLYTEEQIFELFQRFKAEEQATTQRAREERELPLEIITSLDDVKRQQHLDNFKRYKRDISKYYHNEWTVGEEINKSFLPKLKNHTVDTTQVVNAYYKGSEINRTHGRAATELYEQLHTIKRGNLPADQAHQLLDEAIESAKRLAIHAWFHARQQDEDAKQYATKALKLPQSLRHLESRESSTKRDAFNPEFVESYYEASFQEDLLRKSANNSYSYSGRGRGWNNNRGRGRGKNFQGGRGRGNFNSNNNFPNNSHNNSTTQTESINHQ